MKILIFSISLSSVAVLPQFLIGQSIENYSNGNISIASVFGVLSACLYVMSALLRAFYEKHLLTVNADRRLCMKTRLTKIIFDSHNNIGSDLGYIDRIDGDVDLTIYRSYQYYIDLYTNMLIVFIVVGYVSMFSAYLVIPLVLGTSISCLILYFSRNVLNKNYRHYINLNTQYLGAIFESRDHDELDINLYDKSSKELLKLNNDLSIKNNLLTNLGVIPYIVSLVSLFMLGSYMINIGLLSYGVILSVFLIIEKFHNSINIIVSIITSNKESKEREDRINKILDGEYA